MSNDETWEDVADQPLPRYAMEESVVGRLWLLESGHLWEANKPESELQALMEAKPGDDPVEPRNWKGSIYSEVEQIVDTMLTDEERDVIQVTVFAGHSVRKASEILGWPKSTVHRLKQSALRIIERELNVGTD